MSDGDAADLTELEPPRRAGSLKTRSLVVGGVLLVVAGAALFTWKQVKPVVESRKYAKVTYEVPKAPKLTPKQGETVYRIDPTRSSLRYEVQERFAGKSTSTATGTTSGIAGDIAVDPTSGALWVSDFTSPGHLLPLAHNGAAFASSSAAALHDGFYLALLHKAPL